MNTFNSELSNPIFEAALRHEKFAKALRNTSIPDIGIHMDNLTPSCVAAGGYESQAMWFDDAFELLLNGPGWTLVHGTLGRGGIVEAYAWLEHEELQVVFDVDLDRCFRSETYKQHRGVNEAARYSPEGAMLMHRLSGGSSGPWFMNDGPHPLMN